MTFPLFLNGYRFRKCTENNTSVYLKAFYAVELNDDDEKEEDCDDINNNNNFIDL